MLKINKNSLTKWSHYNLTFLFRVASLRKTFLLKEKKSQTITLRAPKHFNIGKHKIYSLKTKALNYRVFFKKHMNINFFFKNQKTWTILSKLLSRSVHMLPKTISLRITTKFKLKWLEF